VKVAAYQAPLAACVDPKIISLIRQQVDRCEALGVELLCCPEALLGGLADDVACPERVAIDASVGELDRLLAPLASDSVTIVVGFTELGGDGCLYNAAAVFSRGGVLGIYRKMHPAINRSVYHAGTEASVFTVGNVTFGILICRDSLFSELARLMVARGAQVLLVPTNNGMPLRKGGEETVTQAHASDIARALESNVPVVRADVAGNHDDLVSYGSSSIVDRNGRLVGTATTMRADLVVADIDFAASSLRSNKALQRTLDDSRR
jgi:predicted amidohydrolase